jgi:DNA topoisomerase-1
MSANLVIVESPAKAKTIEKFLGKDFTVVSSYGHIRDLAKKNLGIDISNNFKPDYIVPDDKKKVVTELKKLVKGSETVWLASDEDREGEAIAWHLYEVLGLKKKETKRIVFHEITKDAILNAIQNPRDINFDLVNAQQARRVLDRLVGFELSPVLWKKVKPSLSAGRVQSVAVRLIVEREREILNYTPTSAFRVQASFITKGNETLNAELSKRPEKEKEVEALLNELKTADFNIDAITKKPSKKSPAAPFTTSTLQQEASRKLGFSVSQTMAVAQKLYESGKITYMRTDSVNLSESALKSAEEAITSAYGAEYHNRRTYTTKAKGAQEAHEAIRPTYLDKPTVSGASNEQKLYELIWKRTIASQMSNAQLEKTTVDILNSKNDKKFVAQGEVLIFDGFLKVYIESTDDEREEEAKGLLPKVSKGEALARNTIFATQRFTYSPPRYTEASLVKKLEELGIGRPSTYAPTISTIQNRGYVEKTEKPGVERKYTVFTLKDAVKKETKTEITGAEKNKLFPVSIGMVVNDFLVDQFTNILDYNFTASVEKEFDEIAQGKIDWSSMIDKFYNPFHANVETTTETSQRQAGERLLGADPTSGKPVFVRIGRYGPMVQIGDTDDPDEKPKYAGIPKGKLMETIQLEEALELFKLPRQVGNYEDKVMTVAIGRFGPYVRHDGKFVSLKKEDDPFSVTADRCIELIEEKREKDRNRIVKKFPENEEIQILNGRWGRI